MTGPFWMKWMAPSTEEQEEAALEEEKERLHKYYITAEKYSVEAQAQERLERPETKSRKAKKDPASKMKQISKKIGRLQEETKADKVKCETLGNLMGKGKKLKKEKQ